MPGSSQPTPGVSLPFGATVTILFSDIRGFTEYTDQYGDEAAYRVLRQHNALVRKQIETFGGRVVKTQGDSFMVYFTTARAAILCAIAIQRAIAEESHHEAGTRIAIGIGINTGEPIQEGGDFFGSTVNLAARICASAGPWQILISETTRYVAGRIEAVEYIDQGLRELKGFQEAQRLFEVSWVPPEARTTRPSAGRELRAEVAALAERFSGLGAELVGASRAMGQSGAPPDERVVEQIEALRAAFAELRGRVLQRAATLGVAVHAAPEALASPRDLQPVLAAMADAEVARAEAAAAAPEDRGARQALESAVQRALAVLNRVLMITHRDDEAFQPLMECQAKASELRLRLSRAVSHDSDYTPARVEEAIVPFADLLVLVVGGENLEDEKYARIEDTVTRGLGRHLAIAASRGRLALAGADTRPASRPAAPAPAAEPTSPRRPGRAVPDEPRAPAPASADESATSSLPPLDPRAVAVAWWSAAVDAWRAWKGSEMATAHALRAAVARHPHLFAVPIRRSAEQEGSRLAADYFLLLEHVENQAPGFIRGALDRAVEAAGGADDPASLEPHLYEQLVTRGRLRETYADFVRDVMIAAIPNPGVWVDGAVTENEDSTVVLRRPEATAGSSAEQVQQLTEQKDRVGDHRFAVTLAPLTARFFAVRRGDVKDMREVEITVTCDGEPCDEAWVLALRSDYVLHSPPKRHAVPLTSLPGFGKNFSGLWIGVFNADPERDRAFEVALAVRPEVRVTGARSSIFGTGRTR